MFKEGRQGSNQDWLTIGFSIPHLLVYLVFIAKTFINSLAILVKNLIIFKPFDWCEACSSSHLMLVEIGRKKNEVLRNVDKRRKGCCHQG